jgi:hypothetical protein
MSALPASCVQRMDSGATVALNQGDVVFIGADEEQELADAPDSPAAHAAPGDWLRSRWNRREAHLRRGAPRLNDCATPPFSPVRVWPRELRAPGKPSPPGPPAALAGIRAPRAPRRL